VDVTFCGMVDVSGSFSFFKKSSGHSFNLSH
jgi:hypothetical protein